MQIGANYMMGAFLHLSCDRCHFAFVLDRFRPALSCFCVLGEDRCVLRIRLVFVSFGELSAIVHSE